MNALLRKTLPYAFMIMLVTLGYNYLAIFSSYDFDDYYGQYINEEAANFSLLDSSGKEVTLGNFQGDFLLIAFGFTRCTGVCPLNLYRFKKISKKLAQFDLKDNLSFAFISFDNIRDDKQAMKEYIDNFSIPKLFGLLSGKDSAIDVARKYKNIVQFSKEKAIKDEQYQVNHNGFLYLVAPNGKLAIIYMQKEVDVDLILKDIKKLRKESILE